MAHLLHYNTLQNIIKDTFSQIKLKLFLIEYEVKQRSQA